MEEPKVTKVTYVTEPHAEFKDTGSNKSERRGAELLGEALEEGVQSKEESGIKEDEQRGASLGRIGSECMYKEGVQ